jgi:hypothetical protein
MPEPRGHTLFTDTLRVMNRAIAAHEDSPPFREIIARTKALPDAIRLGVEIYEHDPSAPVDHYGIRIHDGRFEVASRTREPVTDWRVSLEYLRRVAEDPQTYIDDPRKLDLGWLERRLGIGG